MSKFYVGQRVRIKWSNNYPELNGTTGTILSLPNSVKETSTGERYVGYDCAPDLWGTSKCPYEDAEFCPRAEQLEPATDSYDVVSWEACLWMPEDLRVSA